MINPQWLEVSMSRTNFHRPRDVRAIEVRLYIQKGGKITVISPESVSIHFTIRLRLGSFRDNASTSGLDILKYFRQGRSTQLDSYRLAAFHKRIFHIRSNVHGNLF